MTPPKDKELDRDPTVVYPNNSPSLQRAYRIFGPGQNTPEALDGLKKNMFVSERTPEPGESWLTPAGQEVGQELGVGVAEILESYAAYREDIERMNRVDSIHEKRKQARLTTDSPGGGGRSSDNHAADESSSSSSSSSSGGGEWLTQVDASARIRGRTHAWAEGEDPLEQFWRDPVLWLSREDAAARVRAQRAIIGEVRAAAKDISESCEKTTGMGGGSRDRNRCLVEAARKCARHTDTLVVYAETLEDIVRLHEGKTAMTKWESRDESGVTFGPRVLQTINKIYNLDERLHALKPVVATCKRIQAKLDKIKLLTDKKELRLELRGRLVQFATLCLADEAQKGFRKDMEEKIRQWDA